MMNLSGEFLGLIPSVTTTAGTSLTIQNWSDSGINWISLDLASLLIKPGYSVLTTLKNLQEYVDWGQNIILDASSLTLNKQSMYKIRSTYDGSFIQHTEEEIAALILALKPHLVLLASNMEIEETPDIIPIAAEPVDMEQCEHRAYLAYTAGESWDDFLLRLKNHSYPYVIGNFTAQQMLEIAAHNVLAIQSDKPAQDALQGLVYAKDESIDLQSPLHQLDFRPMDADCKCPTCGQKFTRAYLHHLLSQTPLLCQRLLIQHNIHHCQSILTSR